jgi:NADH pyrophosphatase NudC (nudix superfamily)
MIKDMSEPSFTPSDGQVDYTNIRYCPVINCVLKYQDKILLVQRSQDLRLYPGYWNGISGFLDDNKSVEEKVNEELADEAGVTKANIVSIQPGNVLIQESQEYKKTWLVFPVLVEVNTDQIKLDWEASSHLWLSVEEAKKLKLLPGFYEVLSELLG